MLPIPRQASSRPKRSARTNAERHRQAQTLERSENRDAAAVFSRWLPLMRRARTDLENHNHFIDQMSVGQLRAAILAAGRWLTKRGQLTEQSDIFWLHREEITQALREDFPCLPVVTQRKQEREMREQMTPPPILGIPEPRVEPRLSYRDEVVRGTLLEDSAIRGVGASAGNARGRARVIPAGTPFANIAPGEILVAENAGPAWTPLFPTLGGLVLSRAALFSHAATTAREYVIPAVINVKDAANRIPD